jgi:hypothetical protein
MSSELHHALQNGILTVQVSFLEQEGAPPWYNEPEVRYFNLHREAWHHGARANWNSNTIEFNGDYFDCPDYDLEVIDFHKSCDLELFGYIPHPERAILTLQEISDDVLSKVGPLGKFRTHLWAEIYAVIWRNLAVKDYRRQHGHKQKLVSSVEDYLDRVYGDALGSEKPRDSQLWEVIDKVLEQFDAKDSSSPIAKRISTHRLLSKRRNSEKA